MNRVFAVGLATAFTVASVPAFAQQGLSLGGPRTMGSPQAAQGGGDLWRRPGGGGRGWQGGGGRGWQGGGGRAYGYGRGDGRWRRDRGYGVGAGLAGLAAGAVIGGALTSGYGYDYGSGYGYPAYRGYPAYDSSGYDPEDAADVAPAAATDGDSTAYCIQRFKSYDPSSGTYLGYDGLRHPCP